MLTAMLASTGLSARAAQPDNAPESLKLAPANAAFYSATLRNREQLDTIVKSRAWAKLMSMPAVKQGFGMLEQQMKNSKEWAQFQKLLEAPDNKELVALLEEMVSDEVFSVGDAAWSDLPELFNRVFGAMSGQMMQLSGGNLRGVEAQQAVARALANALLENSKLVKLPDTVIGFRVTDQKKAQKQLKRLEDLADQLVKIVPPLKDRYTKTQIAGGRFLALNFDGTLIPWQDVPLKDLDLGEEKTAQLVRTLSNLKLSINIGVKGNYLLLGIGGSTRLLASLGGKGGSLADRPELAPLLKHLDRKVISIGYTSKEWRQSGGATKEDYNAMKEQVKSLLDKSDLTDKQKQAIIKDANEQIEAMKKLIPEPGARLSYAFLTDKGQEAYELDYGKFPGQTRPKALTLLNHLGGSPLLAGVAYSDTGMDNYRQTAKLVEMIWGHLDEVLQSRLPAEAKDKYTQVVKSVVPLIKRLDNITRTMLLPACDGQTGIVIDAKLTSNRWHMAMPRTQKPLPMLEIGLLDGLRDSALYLKALTEYRKLIEDAVGVFRELAPDANIPDFKFPAPETVKKAGGTYYVYSLPPFGQDEKIKPVIAIGMTVAAYTLSVESAERLLASKPLQVKDTALADPNKPLISASIFDWAGLVDAAEPWIEFVVMYGTLVPRGPDGKEKAEKMIKEIMGQVHTVLEVVKVYKGTTVAVYPEEGRITTHSVSIIRDLEK